MRLGLNCFKINYLFTLLNYLSPFLLLLLSKSVLILRILP